MVLRGDEVFLPLGYSSIVKERVLGAKGRLSSWKPRLSSWKPRWYRFISFAIVGSVATSCYFFRKRDTGADQAEQAVLGRGLGSRAGNSNPSLLEGVYAASTTHPPAAIRPDPDRFVRSLLLQYREQGATVARQIGEVENFRLLLGGASEDFSVVPQTGYDATSLLAKLKVAEEVCEGLVDPSGSEHPGWSSILPYPATSADENILFLAQRILGIPSAQVNQDMQSRLREILLGDTQQGSLSNSDYVLVCATLVVDAESLLL